MERRDQLRAAKLVHPPAEARNGIQRAQQRLRGELAEGDDDLRLHDFNLSEEERFAAVDLVRLGIAVARRTALDDVGDVDAGAGNLQALLDDVRQQLTRAA